jgi:hypothetical protein
MENEEMGKKVVTSTEGGKMACICVKKYEIRKKVIISPKRED